ncbi:MAG TPA: HlyD family secretion protein [Opitutaceae bacterium]|jgi:membrane fusion protein (multidrug efflux system)|nr:HlyD family secretion protein [Opitutaceae bacterium]
MSGEEHPARPEHREHSRPHSQGQSQEEGDAGEQKRQGASRRKPKGPPWYKRPAIVLIVVVVVIAVAITVVLVWRHSETHIYTDDAYVDVVSQQVSPQVSGRVLRVLVNDNQDVKAGQVLVEIDPSDYDARLATALASRAQAQAQLTEANAQVTVYEAQLEKARADLGTAQANATNANNDLARYRRLKAINAGAVSGQQLDAATAAAVSDTAQLNAAQKSVAAAQAQVGYARSQVAAAQAGIRSADASVREAHLNLSYTQVKARVDGRVTSKTVSPGNVVSPGTPLMAIVPRDVYITANFKETQLQHMRYGQPVTITVDAYPDMKLKGHVDSVQAATGEALSMVPAENATGNWVKIVQRVPVKIDIDNLPDDPQRRLGPGMSVEVSVDRQ